jgi:hypothetical protein
MNSRKVPGLLVSLLVALLTISAVSVDRLKAHVDWLSDPAREGRRAGTAGAAAAAEYIAQQFKDLGCDVQMQEFGRGRRNVVARGGTAQRHLIIGAHYDGQGTGMPSASDNAAGVAVIIEIMRELKSRDLPLSIVAVAFDDEEQGLNGSRYYSDNPIYPLEQTHAVIVFDTMGRPFMDLSTWTMFVLGSEYSTELAGVIEKRSRPEMLVVGTDLIGPRSDFAPFAVKKIPYLFFSHATHKDYHGPGDTPDRVNHTKLAQDANFIADILQDVARMQTRPKFLDQPVYPAGEARALRRELELVEKEKKDLPAAYHAMFADFKMRLEKDDTRDVRRVATSALLALATPRMSSFMLTFLLGPYYEREKNREIAAAIYEESLKWAEGDFERRELQEKIKSLRAPIEK